jgi:hypothetical protein
VAKQLGISEQTLANWRKAAAAGKLAASSQKVRPEEMEFSRLRAENQRLKMEVEILKNVWSAPPLASLHVERRQIGLPKCIRPHDEGGLRLRALMGIRA